MIAASKAPERPTLMLAFHWSGCSGSVRKLEKPCRLPLSPMRLSGPSKDKTKLAGW